MATESANSVTDFSLAPSTASAGSRTTKTPSAVTETVKSTAEPLPSVSLTVADGRLMLAAVPEAKAALAVRPVSLEVAVVADMLAPWSVTLTFDSVGADAAPVTLNTGSAGVVTVSVAVAPLLAAPPKLMVTMSPDCVMVTDDWLPATLESDMLPWVGMSDGAELTVDTLTVGAAAAAAKGLLVLSVTDSLSAVDIDGAAGDMDVPMLLCCEDVRAATAADGAGSILPVTRS